MTDDEWEQRRNLAIMTAFQTGRPTFADSEGRLRFADGDCEIIDTASTDTQPLPKALVRGSWWSRLKQWARSK